VLVLDGNPADIAGPVVRQRRRLAETWSGFSETEWANPSRCEGWSSRDVILHLDSTNTFWSFSITQGLAGAPTEFLTTFDPVVTPADLVVAAGNVPAACAWRGRPSTCSRPSAPAARSTRPFPTGRPGC